MMDLDGGWGIALRIGLCFLIGCGTILAVIAFILLMIGFFKLLSMSAWLLGPIFFVIVGFLIITCIGGYVWSQYESGGW